MQIIRLLRARGTMRFGALEDALDQPSTSTLSRTLTALVEEGLINRQSYEKVPQHVEYSLTARGRELDERLKSLLVWATEDQSTNTHPQVAEQ